MYLAWGASRAFGRSERRGRWRCPCGAEVRSEEVLEGGRFGATEVGERKTRARGIGNFKLSRCRMRLSQISSSSWVPNLAIVYRYGILVIQMMIAVCVAGVGRRPPLSVEMSEFRRPLRCLEAHHARHRWEYCRLVTQAPV